MERQGKERKRNVEMGEGGGTSLRARLETRRQELAATFGDAAYSGRGIVIAAGGQRLFVNAYVLVHLLRRRLGCATPIEVWHYGVDEMSPRMKALLADLGVETVDATGLAARAGVAIRDGWQLKPLALLGSRFAEVLLLDADQVPVVDPSVAFDWPQYRDAGAVFWPDVLDVKADNPIWAELGLAGERRVSLESGQALVDKRRGLRAALATLALNEAAETVYRYVYGDKDTLQLGWMLADAPFALVPHRPFAEERALVQRDFDGNALFQHRTNCKWTYAGEQYSFKAAIHQDACLAALEALRALWNGRIFNPPSRSAAARELEATLVAAARMECEVAGEAPFVVEFQPDGELGEGRSHDRANWAVVDDPTDDSRRELIIWDARGRAAYRLAPGSDGGWRGERSLFPAAPLVATLGPAAAPAPAVAGAQRGLVDDFLAAAGFGPLRADDAELSAALVLLARVEPGVAERLRFLAGAEGRSAQLSARLTALAAAVEAARPVALGVLVHDLGVFERGYHRVPDLQDWRG
jgi:hypothetical protein